MTIDLRVSYVTKSAAANLLGVHRVTIGRMAAAGRVATVTVCGREYILLNSVLEIRKARMQAGFVLANNEEVLSNAK